MEEEKEEVGDGVVRVECLVVVVEREGLEVSLEVSFTLDTVLLGVLSQGKVVLIVEEVVEVVRGDEETVVGMVLEGGSSVV